MSGRVALRALRDLRRGFAWWSLGLIGLAAMMVAVYPSVRESPALEDLAQNYPEALQELFSFGGGGFDYASPAGYLGIELFSLMVPSSSSTSCGSTAPNGPSPAASWAPTTRAPTSAPAAETRCSAPARSASRAPAGPPSPGRWGPRP